MGQEKSWRVFWSSNISKTGVFLLSVQVLLSIYVVASYPLDFGTRFWNNPAYWADNPKEAPPEWTNFFTSKPSPIHITIVVEKPGDRF
ncbi:MAG: hypothetical protein QXJ09_07555, partial [Candidatus Caldarchaeum sp.]